MEIITNTELYKTIRLEDITDDHIIVMVRNNKPYILSRDNFGAGSFKFLSISTQLSDGNNIEHLRLTKKELLLNYIDDKYSKIEAFYQDDWKEALKWLIDNCGI